MGAVWRARHLTLNLPLAIKFVDPALAQSSEAQLRFTREARAAATLQGCPNVVQVIDYGVYAKAPFIAMELLIGETLGEYLARVGPLSLSETLQLLSQVVRGITRAHEAGIVHRDLKPGNIFLSANDGQPLVKVLDFGIAKVSQTTLEGTSPTRTGTIMGTPYYMSPEQAEGNREVDHRTDVWALGVIACECITGERPFSGKAIGELVLKICSRPLPRPSDLGPVPSGFDAWFAQACAREPSERFPSVRHQIQALALLLTQTAMLPPTLGAPASPYEMDTEAPVTRASVRITAPSKRPLLLGIAAVSLVAFTGVAWWSSKAQLSAESGAPIAQAGEQASTRLSLATGELQAVTRDNEEKPKGAARLESQSAGEVATAVQGGNNSDHRASSFPVKADRPTDDARRGGAAVPAKKRRRPAIVKRRRHKAHVVGSPSAAGSSHVAGLDETDYGF